MSIMYENIDMELELKFQREKKARKTMQYLLKEKKQELLKVNKKLQDIIDRQAEEFIEINRELEVKIKQEVERTREKDKMMFQQAKMAAMGEMIGNIAHQWRQPLNVISTGASGLMIEKEFGMLSDKVLNDTLDQIVNSTQELSQTIENFKNFFKSDKKESRFKIYRAILNTTELMKDSFNHHNIELIYDFGKIDTYGLRNEFTQAIMNILHNSKEFLTERDINKKGLIFIKTYLDENNVYIKIKDNAGGIEEEIIDRIFEPYFTTKHKSNGTGIGLYMTQVIVEKHMRGTIKVENVEYIYHDKLYKGAEFTIELPLIKNIEKST